MKKTADRVLAEMNGALVGKSDAVRKLFIALISGGHVLIEDIPGVGKTTLARSVAAAAGLDTKRIQFTPDTMPTDITGFTMWDENKREFRFHAGAVMTNVLLADEINRTSPRTQSALLQAMEEGAVTEEGRTYELKPPFCVIATQNPLGSAGTMPLPLSQLDRFMMKISLGRPTEKELSQIILTRSLGAKRIDTVCGRDDILAMMYAVSEVYVSAAIADWIARLIEAVNNNDKVVCGASPRAALQLTRAAKASAFLNSREFIAPQDVTYLFGSVIAHRISVAGSSADDILDGILKDNSPPHIKGAGK